MFFLCHKKGIMKKRLFFLEVLFLFLFLFLLIFCFFLQVIKGGYFEGLSRKNRVKMIPIPQSRGMIFDRKSNPLAENIPNFSISIIQEGLSSQKIEDALAKLSFLDGFDIEKVRESLKMKEYRAYEPVCIVDNISLDTALSISEKFFDVPGIIISAKDTRYYPKKDFSSHIIGYIGKISKDELKKRKGEGYFIDDMIGKSGIEREYEKMLRGERGGEYIEVDTKGRTVRVLGKKEPVPGCNLYLTLDSSLQEFVEKSLGKNKGAIIVMDVRTGEILAMVSKPSYNPNIFLRPLTLKEVSSTIFNQNRPLVNRTIQGEYPPGSLFKAMSGCIGLEEKIIKEDDYLRCEGVYEVGKRKFSCIKKQAHGNINIISAFAKSCNIYFYQLGLKIGEQGLIKKGRMFGLGEKTGIDLPYEEKGRLPSSSWKKRILKTKWFAGDTINFSIGQGFLLVTPLQMAVLFSAIANGGKVLKPFLVKYIEYPDGKVITRKSIVKRKVNISQYTKKILDRGLEEVVLSGTGISVYIPGIRIAGKTGTAQTLKEDHAWFACYTPVNEPEIVVVVLVEHGGKGGVEAAPIARRILEEYFGITKYEQEIKEQGIEARQLEMEKTETICEIENEREDYR